MTPAEIAQKIVSNPNGYTEDSVTVARAYLRRVAPPVCEGVFMEGEWKFNTDGSLSYLGPSDRTFWITGRVVSGSTRTITDSPPSREADPQ